MTEPFVTGPGQGTLVGGRGPLIKTFGDETGPWALIEGGLPPRTDGAPLHVHHRHGEGFYVFAGTLTLLLADGEVEAPAGTYAYCPPGLVHGFANRGDEPLRFVSVVYPGIERLLLEMAESESPDDLPGVLARYDSEFV